MRRYVPATVFRFPFLGRAAANHGLHDLAEVALHVRLRRYPGASHSLDAISADRLKGSPAAKGSPSLSLPRPRIPHRPLQTRALASRPSG